MLGELPIPIFPWKYFFFYEMEKSEEIKRELFAEGEEVPVLMHSPEVWEHRQAHILGCPSPHENALLRNWCKKKKMDLMCPINWFHANWRLMMNNWISHKSTISMIPNVDFTWMKKVIIKNLQATPITYRLFIKKDQKWKGEKENEPSTKKGLGQFLVLKLKVELERGHNKFTTRT